MIFWFFRIRWRRLETWKRNSRNLTLSRISDLSNDFSDSTSIALLPQDPYFSLNQLTLAKLSTASVCRTPTPPKRLSRTPLNSTKDATTNNLQMQSFIAKWLAPLDILTTLDLISLSQSRNFHNTSRTHPLSIWQKPNTSSVTSKALWTTVSYTLHRLTDRNLFPLFSLTHLTRLTPMTENHTPDTSHS